MRGVRLVSLAALLMSPLVVAAEPVTAVSVLQFFAGKSFKLKCGDGLYGYGQLDPQGSVWAAFRFGPEGVGEPEKRASATVRAQGSEICATVQGLEMVGELCVPVKQTSEKTYRIGKENTWCDVEIIQRLPPHIDSIMPR
jgi:hypothetical protein